MKQKIKDFFNGNYSLFYEKYLQRVKNIGGNERQALCVFHNDTKPSFSFNSQTGQYYCHGCGKKGDIFHFYAKLNGLDTRRGFGKVLKGIANDFGIPWEQDQKRVVKRYVYTDMNGTPLHRTNRTEPKDFYQQRYDNGKWVTGLKGIEPALYRLPEISKADEVIVVEGEKDADNLANMGFAVTTCPMGAKKWRNHYNQYLEGKKVILIPDNDNEGREHMAKVGASLNGKTANLKLVELPNLPSKGDASDFIASFNNLEDAAERLSILIDNAEPYKPPKTYSQEDAVLTIGQFCELEIQERQCYISPWLKENSITLINGSRGIGKSFFAQSILNAVVNEKSFGPWECGKSEICGLLDGEMSVQDLIERSNYLNLNSERLFIYSDAYANRLGLPRAHLANESWRKKMKSILVARKIKLWAVDNIASLASGLDENSKKDWDPINTWLLELRFAGISTILLHHTNKEGGQRGTSAREDNIDISIVLKRPHDYTPEDGARFIVHFTKARVPTKDLQLIADTEFKLIQNESGIYEWVFGNLKKERKKEIIKMLDEGADYNMITDTLGISKGYITKIKKQAIEEELLTSKCKMTQSGFSYVEG